MAADHSTQDIEANAATHAPTSPGVIAGADYPAMRKASRSTDSVHSTEKERIPTDANVMAAKDSEEIEESRLKRHFTYERYRPLILGGVAAVILGWWISSTSMSAIGVFYMFGLRY